MNKYFYNIIMNYLLKNIDISKHNNMIKIRNEFIEILKTYEYTDNYLNYFNFTIIKDDNENYKIIGSNFFSSLLIIGVFINDAEIALNNDLINIDDILYEYDAINGEIIIKNK